MNIQLSDHFDTRRLLRFALPSILMMVFTSVYGVVDGFFVSNFVGKTPFAAVNFIMPFLMVLGALGFMLGTGGSALMGKLLGEENGEKANQVFSLLIYVTLIAGVVVAAVGMLLLGEVLARPLAHIFVGYDEELMDVTLHAFRIYSFTFLLCGVPIFGSSFFTALNDGLTSALISFLRTVVFQVAAVLLLPLLFGLDGIWYSLIVAELAAAAVTVFFWVKKREVYS